MQVVISVEICFQHLFDAVGAPSPCLPSYLLQEQHDCPQCSVGFRTDEFAIFDLSSEQHMILRETFPEKELAFNEQTRP